MASLLAISEAVSSSSDLRDVLATILRLTVEEVQAQQGSILMFDEHQDRLDMLATYGMPAEIVEKGYIARRGSIAEYVIENNQPLIINDEHKPAPNPSDTAYQRMDRRRKIVSAMCVPLRCRGKVLGTINLNRTEDTMGVFLDSDLDFMSVLASQAAISIENSRLHEASLKQERMAAIGQTVSGVSHCIKNVLTGVKGGMSLIDMASKADNWQLLNQGKEILQRNLDRLSTFVLDMLDYSKERDTVKSEVPLEALAREVLDTVKTEAEMRKISLNCDLADDARSVMADNNQIYRCVLNLVHNAIDMTPEGGQVWIGVERSTAEAALRRMSQPAQAAIIIRVGDSGPGVPDENRTVIFEPFFSTKGSRGTGLGLAVTRKIIQEHGGHIEVETKAPIPATFAIYLPE